MEISSILSLQFVCNVRGLCIAGQQVERQIFPLTQYVIRYGTIKISRFVESTNRELNSFSPIPCLLPPDPRNTDPIVFARILISKMMYTHLNSSISTRHFLQVFSGAAWEFVIHITNDLGVYATTTTTTAPAIATYLHSHFLPTDCQRIVSKTLVGRLGSHCIPFGHGEMFFFLLSL